MNVFGIEYREILLILSINLVSIIFDSNFLFQGNEEFGFLALRSIVTKVIGILLIFLFVKSENDICIYTFCQSIILIGSNIVVWTKLNKYLVRISIKDLNLRKHLHHS